MGNEQEQNNLVLFGRNAVLEAINHQKPVDKIFLKKGEKKGEFEGTLKVIVAKARERGIPIQEADRQKLDMLSEDGNHQGVVAVCPAKPYVEPEDILTIAKERGEEPFIIVLDGITDPHNLGAILRTADACGAHGVIIPKHRAVGLSGTVAKASSGAIEHVAVSKVTNIATTLEYLKKQGLWVYCATQHGTSLFQTKMDGAIALVIGDEGEGVSRLVLDKSDFRVSIPMLGAISSLNASVAAGVLMYEAVRYRVAK